MSDRPAFLLWVMGSIFLLVIMGHFASQCATWEERMEMSLPYLTKTAKKICQREFNAYFKWELNSPCMAAAGVYGYCKDDDGVVYATIECYDVGSFIRCTGRRMMGKNFEWVVEKE